MGDELFPEMVTRLFEGMRRVDGSGKAKGPSERVPEQFTASMSHLLKGTAEEKSLVILNMISASGGPVKARDVHKVRGHQALRSHPRQCWWPLVGAQDEQQLMEALCRSAPGGPGPHNRMRSGLLDKEASAN